MSSNTNHTAPPANRILAALPKKEYQRLLPELTEVTLAFGEILYDRGEIIRHVYFPTDSIISLLSMVANRSALEIAVVGNEGMAGLSVFMGIDKAALRTLVQGGGSAFRMRSATLRKISNQSRSLHTLLHRYTHSLFTQISQSCACNRFHTVDMRIARWLLMTSDRIGAVEFQLTQDRLSHMVGVRREAVNKVAVALQKEKLIDYSRGAIVILDRSGLEAVSCACYAIIKESNVFLKLK